MKFYSHFSKQTSIIAIFLLCFTMVIYVAHMQHVFTSDVASLLYDTELFLSGGTYVKDFFETNPPMILILYTPIVMLHKFTHFDIISLTYFYIIALAYISLAFCYSLIKLCVQDIYFKQTILFVLLCVFLVTPAMDFGQREHLLCLLGMPYLFAVVCRAKNISIPLWRAALIGLMAGMVFSLKPFFLIPLIFIELYLMIVKKNLFSWMRIEALVVLCVMTLYVAYVLTYHPLYFNVLMPLISQFYFIGTEESWLTIFSKPRVIFCTAVAGYYFFFQKKHASELSHVLFLTLVGFILAFIVPGSAWNYHVLPAYTIALLLSVIYIYSLWAKEINQHVLKMKDILFIIAAGFFMPIVIFSEDVFQVIIHAQYKDIHTLRARAKTLPHSVYCFSSISTGLCFPLVTVNQKEFAGRFPVLWWVRGLRKMENRYADQELPADVVKQGNFLIDAVAYDLDHYQPELIIAYKGDETLLLPEGYDYPTYFSKRDAFKKAWSHYQLSESIGPFDLYKRIKT